MEKKKQHGSGGRRPNHSQDKNSTATRPPVKTELVGQPCGCILEGLLVNPFRNRDSDEQKRIVDFGRPTPPLPNLIKSNHSFVRHFQETQYSKTKWLTGCPGVNKLYCWPCLLFTNDKCSWTTYGVSDLNNLHTYIKRHEESRDHLQCIISLSSYGEIKEEIAQEEQKRITILKHNKEVQKNREVLKRLVEIVCFIGGHHLNLLGGVSEGPGSLKNGSNLVDLLNVLSDEKLASQLSKASAFTSASRKVQNDLISAVTNVILDNIQKEIKHATFVSIVVDETSNIASQSRVSTVLRYVNRDQEVCERFVGYSDSVNRSTSSLCEHVCSIALKYGCSEKLVAQSYDGAAVKHGELNNLQALIRRTLSDALLIHSSAHSLSEVISNALSHIRACKRFFSSVHSFSLFFTQSPKRKSALDALVTRRFPQMGSASWNHRLIHSVLQFRGALLELFQYILDNPSDWDDESLLQTRGLENVLEEFEFCFLLNLFSVLFSYTDDFYETIQKKKLDVTFCKNKFSEVRQKINKQKNNFDAFWSETEKFVCSPPRKKRRTGDPMSDYKKMFHEILESVASQLEIRFHSLENLRFTELLDISRFKLYQVHFPDTAFEMLKRSYASHFDIFRLRNELCALYAFSDFIFSDFCDLLRKLSAENLRDALKEIYKLCELILTIPATVGAVDRTFTALKRVRSYSVICHGQEQQNLAVISIENELLRKLKKSELFYNDVINEFLLSERRLELVYK